MMNKKANIFLAPDFEEVEAITPIDLLRRAGIDVRVIGLLAMEVKGSHGIRVLADEVLAFSTSLPDAVILPGGPGHKHLLDSDIVLEFVKKMFLASKLCAAICAAPSVFGKAGILRGKNATSFPGYEDKLDGASFINQPVVVDGNVITSRGAGTAVPFSLEIIRYLVDEHAAATVASAIVFNDSGARPE
jgi:4-methyl-5(b-hydroxyethyl)-thiazole monophosphate biosynthesis